MDKKLVNGNGVLKKYNVAHSEKLGRYIVAAKDLAAGELIFREGALAVGPALFEANVFCFSCMRPLPAYRDIKSRYACSKCNVAPLCNRACESAVGCHSSRECDLFRDSKDLYLEHISELSRILLHLRLWLLKDDESGSWAKVEAMEAHLDKRRDTAVWHEREAMVVEVFRRLGLAEGTSDESVQRLCGVVDVNTFELRAPGIPSDAGPLRGLFLQASLMVHECRPTAHVSVDEGFHMSVHAATAVPTGGLISFNYTSSLLGTIDRQAHLQEGKYFRCECEACEDPLEAGSWLSCILCPRCKKDYVAVASAKDREPYGREAKWRCRSCKKSLSGCLVKSTIEIAKDLISDVDEHDLRAMDCLMEKLSRSFHKNHYLMLSLKNKILAVCRKELARLSPQKRILQRMLELCKEVVDVLEIVEPGLSRLKGILLYEMHLPATLLANRAYAAREIGSSELLSRLEVARGLLRRALAMLLLEPPATPEGQLARRALQEAKILGRSLEDAEALAALARREERQPRASRQRRGRNGRK